jgi:glycosyltransferase involved in cell wall biosynthesis
MEVPPLDGRLVTELPDRLSIGMGTALFLEGRCSHPGGPVAALRVLVDGDEHPVIAHDMPRPGAAGPGDRWWAIIRFGRRSGPATVTISLRARVGGDDAVCELGTLQLDPGESPASEAAGPSGANGARPLVAICMATYNPPRDLFERQIQSIRQQTHGNWICLISDDASDPEHVAGMREVLDGDPRFELTAWDERRGFYGNFERALGLTPPAARFVTLADQDDRWYPERLEVLLSRVEPGVTLVYSDMRIVGRDGQVVSDTYWRYRRNNHTNFASLLIANTVTGAASLFPRDLLDYALPFPPAQGNAYHDHWLAIVALALGRLAYVDRPLYDYVQHVDAALGHTAANATGVRRSQEGGPLGGLRSDVARLRMQKLDLGLQTFYFDVYCWLALVGQVVEMRCGEHMTRRKRRAVHRLRSVESSPLGFAWLGLRSLRPLAGATETFGRERPLMLALGWRRAAPWIAQLRARARPRATRAWRRRAAKMRPARMRGAITAIGPARRARRQAGAAPATGEAWLTPILVDYFTRDGSTLMMRLLASSPNVAVDRKHPYERKYFAYLWRWSRLLDRSDWPVDEWTPRNLASILLERDAPLMGPPPWLPRALVESGPGEPSMSRRCFDLAWGEFSRRAAQRTLADHGDPGGSVRYYAEKHLNTWRLDFDALPEIRVIALLRDPRDTYISINAFNERRGTQGFGRQRAGTEREYIVQMIARQRERLDWIMGLPDDGPIPVVRYDELIGDLPGVAARLERSLSIRLRPEQMGKDERERRRHLTSASPQESIGRWRREMPAEVQAIFATELGEELDSLGFEV